MAFDKVSVREKVDEVKETFLQLKQEGKLSPEILALMNSMFLVVDLILSILMEKQTKKTKHNSSLPSSQTEKDETGPLPAGAHGQRKPLKEGMAHPTRVNKTVT